MYSVLAEPPVVGWAAAARTAATPTPATATAEPRAPPQPLAGRVVAVPAAGATPSPGTLQGKPMLGHGMGGFGEGVGGVWLPRQRWSPRQGHGG